MIRGIHHVAISTPDLDRLLGFYRDLLGFEEVMTGGWSEGSAVIDNIVGLKNSAARAVMLKSGNICVEIFEYSSPSPQPMDPNRPVCDHGHTHMALDVVDIDRVYERLRVAGIRFHCPPQQVGNIKTTYGRDPDGNVLELQELLDADDRLQVF